MTFWADVDLGVWRSRQTRRSLFCNVFKIETWVRRVASFNLRRIRFLLVRIMAWRPTTVMCDRVTVTVKTCDGHDPGRTDHARRMFFQLSGIRRFISLVITSGDLILWVSLKISTVTVVGSAGYLTCVPFASVALQRAFLSRIIPPIPDFKDTLFFGMEVNDRMHRHVSFLARALEGIIFREFLCFPASWGPALQRVIYRCCDGSASQRFSAATSHVWTSQLCVTRKKLIFRSVSRCNDCSLM